MIIDTFDTFCPQHQQPRFQGLAAEMRRDRRVELETSDQELEASDQELEASDQRWAVQH